MTSNYNKYPATKVEGYHVFCGYETILEQLKKEEKKENRFILVIRIQVYLMRKLFLN